MSFNVSKTLLKAKSLARKGDVDAAAALFTAVLEHFPQNKQAAIGLASLGQHAASATRGAAFPPRDQLDNLLQLFNTGQLRLALETGQQLVSRYPYDPLLHNLIGTASVGLDNFDSAILSLSEAVRLKPDYAEAYSNLGAALNKLGRNQEAIASYTQAIRFAPDDADAHYNLGNSLRDIGKPHEAIASYTKATKIKPSHFMAYYNLGGVFRYLGKLEQAVVAYDNAIQINSGNTDALSNRLYCLSELDNVDATYQLELANSYGKLVSSRATTQYSHWDCARRPEKLSIGFVSADFKNHPVGYFLEGMLSHFDRSAFEVVAYSNSAESDELTTRLKSLFDEWTPIVDRNDAQVARLIHSDAPHILVDLSGHTRDGRLGVFAYKPAPVQITWLGYWATTGVAQIDYKLGDAYVTPVGSEAYFSEDIWRLPNSVLCFTPPADELPLSALPALENGYITFGCFNIFSKLNDDVIAVWAEILNAVRTSRLFLKAEALGDTSVTTQLVEQFASHGITSDRLILEGFSPRPEYFAAYHRVDIALDPFPFPGGTTSAEALWSGVPVLTRKGSGSPLSGQGESIMHSSGMSDWIAHDHADYVQKAILYANDMTALSRLREGLRAQVRLSPFFDARRFAHDFQSAMRGMWQRFELRQ